jgi:hypothetical protein
VTLWSALASGATPPESDPWTRVLAVDAHVGLGTPYGLAGLSVEVSPVRFFAIEAGGGHSGYGPQIAGMARLRIPFGADALALGGGVSGGDYSAADTFLEPMWSKDWSPAYWVNLELAYSHRWRNGFELRPYVGVTSLLNPGDAVCVPNNNIGDGKCGNPATRLPYAGLAIGYAFDL